MIRINLLGTSKKGKRGPSGGGGSHIAMPQVEIGNSAVIVVAVLLFVAAFAGCYFYQQKLSQDHAKIATDLAAQEARIRQLSVVKTTYERQQKEKAQLQKHFDVIDQLRASQSGPAVMLASIGGTVDRSETVWLTKLDDDSKDKNTSLTLNGYALDSMAVAHFMTNLRNSGYFTTVELKDTHEEKFQGLSTFVFTLVCQRQPEKKA